MVYFVLTLFLNIIFFAYNKKERLFLKSSKVFLLLAVFAHISCIVLPRPEAFSLLHHFFFIVPCVHSSHFFSDFVYKCESTFRSFYSHLCVFFATFLAFIVVVSSVQFTSLSIFA